MKLSHQHRAVDAVARVSAEGKAAGHESERKWWTAELRKLLTHSEDLHGTASYVSWSSILALIQKRAPTRKGPAK